RNGTKTWRAMRAYAWTPAFAGATRVGLDSGLRRSDECESGLWPCRSDECGFGLRPSPERRVWVWIPACAGTTTDFAKRRWGVMSWRDVRSDALHFASGWRLTVLWLPAEKTACGCLASCDRILTVVLRRFV